MTICTVETTNALSFWPHRELGFPCTKLALSKPNPPYAVEELNPMTYSEASDLIRKLRMWVDETLSASASPEIHLAEAKEEYRKVLNVIEQLEDLGSSIPEEIKEKKKILIKQIYMSNERSNVASLAKELSSLAKDINYRLKGMQSSKRISARRSPTKLRVSFSNGLVICENAGTETFVKTLEHIGLQRVAEWCSMNMYGHPLVSTQEKEMRKDFKKSHDYYIDTGFSTKDKKKHLQRISDALEIDLTIEIIDK